MNCTEEMTLSVPPGNRCTLRVKGNDRITCVIPTEFGQDSGMPLIAEIVVSAGTTSGYHKLVLDYRNRPEVIGYDRSGKEILTVLHEDPCIREGDSIN